MASLGNRLLSFLFYWSYRLRTARWLIGLVLLWWGWVVLEKNPVRGYTLWGSLVLLFLITQIAHASSYVVVRRNGRLTEPAWHAFPDAVIGTATGCFTQSHRLGLSPYFGFNLSVQLRWQKGYRPPFLAATNPAKVEPALVYQGDGLYSEWYPGSAVESVWFWSAGRECSGLRVSFAGRWLLIELEDGDAAAVRQLLAG